MKRQLLILLLVAAVGCDTKEDPNSQKPPANGTTGVPKPGDPDVNPPPDEDPPSRDDEVIPLRHWAYMILHDFAREGLAQRYPAFAFKGGRIFSRREMAEVIADVVKAMKADPPIVTETRLAKVLRLIKEFGPELSRLGVSTDLPAAVATPKEAVETWLAFIKEWDEFVATRRGDAYSLASAELAHSISLSVLTDAQRTRAEAKLNKIRQNHAISRRRPTHTITDTKLPEPGRVTILSKKRKGDVERLLGIELVLSEGRWWIQTIRLAGNPSELMLLDVAGERLVTVPPGFEWTEDRSTPEKAAGGYAELFVRIRAAQHALFVENTRVGIEILRRTCVSEIAEKAAADLEEALNKGADHARAMRAQIGAMEHIDATHARFKLRTPIHGNRAQVERIELVKVKDEWLVERVGEPCTYCRVSGKCGACKGTGVGKSGVACALCLGARRCHRCDGTGYHAR